ncbi:MAG: hypothetical protein AMXMBFR20_15010 [Planctomycetia bacterium]|jgi:hypothetical protein|nr:MAG: hypothetical protein B6D36_01815 [Planctomycetes bacterium UTPLA1]
MTIDPRNSQRFQLPVRQWTEHDDTELREFAALTPTQKFRLLMQTIEFLQAIDRARPGMEKCGRSRDECGTQRRDG